MARYFALSLALAFIPVTAGCGSTFRSMTATAWLEPQGGPAAAPAAPTSGGGVRSQFYLTYYEGTCRWLFGCDRGDTHVKRCKLNPDNTMTCVEEANATKALNPD